MKYRCPEFLKEMLDAIAGDERLVVTIGAGAVDAGLLMGGWLTGGEYVTLTLATVAVYISAKSVDNVAASMGRAKIGVAEAGTGTGDTK